MRLLARAAAVLFLASLAAGCNKGPAEDALEAARRALEAARPDLARYTPEELASLDDAIADARSQLAEGHYTEALKVAQGLPARIDAAAAASAAKKEVLTKAWRATAEPLKPWIEGLSARMAELAGTKETPSSFGPDRLASARADLQALTTAWSRAEAAFGAGDVAGALATAQDAKARAEALSRALGLPPPVAVAAAARPPVPR